MDRTDLRSGRIPSSRKETAMPRRLGLTLVAVLALALFTAALAQVRFESTQGAFPDADEGPEEIAFTLRLDDDGDVVFVLVEEGTGTVPNARTGFSGGDVPLNALADVNAVAALQRCSDLVDLAGGIVLVHEDLTIDEAMTGYVRALEGIGLVKVADRVEAGCYVVDFEKPSGEMLRLRLHPEADGVQVYFGL
jgi:hypothetical protein